MFPIGTIVGKIPTFHRFMIDREHPLSGDTTMAGLKVLLPRDRSWLHVSRGHYEGGLEDAVVRVDVGFDSSHVNR